MRIRSTRWWMIVGCWSCAACVAWAQPADSPPLAPPEPLPAAEYADSGMPCDAECSPTQVRPQSRVGAWWNCRVKPCLQESHWGYPEEFEEIPHGVRLRMAQRAQICSGWTARLWLYRYDFCDQSPTLNAAGRKRLYDLAREFPVWMQHTLQIEATGRPQLDAARCEQVTKLLVELGTPAHVVIGVPTPGSPFGDETQWWYSRFERQVRAGGGLSGGGMAGTGMEP